MNVHKYDTSAIFFMCTFIHHSAFAFQFHSFPFGCLCVCRACVWHSILTWMCQLLASLNINQWHLIIPFHRFWQTKQKSRAHVCAEFYLGRAELLSTKETRFKQGVSIFDLCLKIYVFAVHACSWVYAASKMWSLKCGMCVYIMYSVCMLMNTHKMRIQNFIVYAPSVKNRIQL